MVGDHLSDDATDLLYTVCPAMPVPLLLLAKLYMPRSSTRIPGSVLPGARLGSIRGSKACKSPVLLTPVRDSRCTK